MNGHRNPHAPLDVPSRYLKGLKIERLIGLSTRSAPLTILEVGTGSGGISHYFGTHEKIICEVESVDVCDVRVIKEGYNFQLVNDVKLPYEEMSFDVVISNHVIEHVGDQKNQQYHLNELFRVLKPDGIGYLAVPNRWMLIEPHYKLPFLSWLPKKLRSPYLSLMKKGKFYDCEPLTVSELEGMLKAAQLNPKNLSNRAIRETFAIESPDSIANNFIKITPNFIFDLLKPLIPTLIYSFKRDAQ